MNILIGAAVGAALPWLFTLIWAFIYWDFDCARDMNSQNARSSVIFAILGAFLVVVNGGAA